MTTIALIGAGARGMYALGAAVLSECPDAKIVAVAEPKDDCRAACAAKHGIAPENCFTSWEPLLAKGKIADAMIIATPDDLHYAPCIAALEAGYDVLLEKPMSNQKGEAERIADKADETGRLLMVCHELRYTPFFMTLKRLIEDGAVGRVASIQHNENVGYFHQAHSFVRGNWRNSAEACPMILAKCCHDMDILNFLIGKRCVSLASYGSLLWFQPENAPEGAADRCLDCMHSGSCAYSATRYFDAENNGFRELVDRGDDEALRCALRDGPYGRCAYRCDNDVVDHQVVSLLYEDGVTVAFTMCAFTEKFRRSIKVMGVKGEIHGEMDKGELIVVDFERQTRETIHVDSPDGHGGGDTALVRDFIACVRGESEPLTSARVSVASHAMAWAAEEARLTGQTMRLKK